MSNPWAVWVACVNTLDIKLYHGTKYFLLAEINLKQYISQRLNGFDDLIKFHKLACLKITSMHVCKDTLWIGTSSGVLVYLHIPLINNNTTKINSPLNLNGKFNLYSKN